MRSLESTAWNSNRCKGVVLLSMLLILALLAALAYQMVGRHGLLIAQTRYSFTQDRALAYALGAEALARQVLYLDHEDSQGGKASDHLEESWAQPLALFEIDDGLMEVQLRDLHSCFNLNSLAVSSNDQNHTRFKNLLRSLQIPETFADSWQDWVDADQEITGFGAEDGEYLLLDDGYRTANRHAGHISELKLIRDMTPRYYELLSQHTCVLPTSELKLNVNTVGASGLAALSRKPWVAALARFVDGKRAYVDVEDAIKAIKEEGATLDDDVLTVTSEFFQVQVLVQLAESRVELTSLLRRDQNDGRITLISRDLGKDFRSLFNADGEERGDSLRQWDD